MRPKNEKVPFLRPQGTKAASLPNKQGGPAQRVLEEGLLMPGIVPNLNRLSERRRDNITSLVNEQGATDQHHFGAC